MFPCNPHSTLEGSIVLIFLKKCLEREIEQGQRQRERESQGDATVSAEPNVGLDLMTLRSRPVPKNQESDAQPTEPLRCPERCPHFKGDIEAHSLLTPHLTTDHKRKDFTKLWDAFKALRSKP